MFYDKIVSFFSFLLLISRWTALPAAGDGERILWELGRADNDTSEFALGPSGYESFEEDAFYVVGLSQLDRDWPYVHPGPSDGWAGERIHEFVLCFGVAEKPQTGSCRLCFDLVDTHRQSPPHLEIALNDRSFRSVLPPGGTDDSVFGDPAQGKEHRFGVTFSVEDLKVGDNLIRIRNRVGSWLLYDWLGFQAPEGVVLQKLHPPRLWLGPVSTPPVLFHGREGLEQCLRLEIRYLGEPTEATFTVKGQEPVVRSLKQGLRTIDLPVTPLKKKRRLEVQVESSGIRARSQAELEPVRRWTLFLLHHTHLDIGYTHLQPEVELRQWEHLERAMNLAKATEGYPEGSRFKWLPEGLWAIDSYLREVNEEKRERFLEAVRRGQVGLDALYGNELTALCRPEELMELVGFARRFSKRYDIPITSAMISDVPGLTWGLVPVLAQNGVNYLSVGPNHGHRIGFTLSQHGDKPFYWISPSGKERILCWVAGKGYAWFHRGPLREEGKLFQYLAELDRNGYPYDMVQVRYNIGGDNGPPDEGLADYVKEWNERYAFPRLVIATTAECFQAFEEVYGAELPELRGDFTPYWEDGAASSAKETAVNRASAERLVQAETVWSLTSPNAFPAEDFHEAWRNVLLYDEHTWGAHNSISQPQSPFALAQWKIKREFAFEGERRSKALLKEALSCLAGAEEGVERVHVINTSSWVRTDLVRVPLAWTQEEKARDRVEEEFGEPVPSQRLSGGDLVFLAEDVPAFGRRTYVLREGSPFRGKDRVEVSRFGLSNGRLSVSLDSSTGDIVHLGIEGVRDDLVPEGETLNRFLYVEGRAPEHPKTSGPAQIECEEAGPLVASLRVTSELPGCRSLLREVRLTAGSDRLDVVDQLDKKAVYAKEAVHIAFPLDVPDGVCRMETPFAVVRPDKDQLPGSCKNYFTAQRWVDVSNDRCGVTLASVDAPLWEVGRLTADPVAVGWLRDTPAPQTALYCYAMNNYWETNYKAAQDGVTTFRFSLCPHGSYEAERAYKRGVEASQPLLLVAASGRRAVRPFRRPVVEGEGVVVSRVLPGMDGTRGALRLFNLSDKETHAKVDWEAVGGLKTYRMDPYEVLTVPF